MVLPALAAATAGHNYFVAFSAKAVVSALVHHTAHGGDCGAPADHVFPAAGAPVVLSVPKRLRYYMQRDSATLNMVLRIFLRVIAKACKPIALARPMQTRRACTSAQWPSFTGSAPA